MKKRSNSIFNIFTLFALLALIITTLSTPTNVHAFGVLITVTTASDNTNNDTVCSLREAITNANTNSAFYPDCGSGLANDQIVFAAALGTATITLSSALPAIADTWGLTIKGGGKITISGNDLYQVFYVNNGVPLTLDGLTVTAGGTFTSTSGGIFNNSGTLTITNSTFSNNRSSIGGGIYNSSGLLTIINSIFSNNSAFSGGGIYNRGTLSVTNGTFSGNGSISGPGGGLENIPGATATITNSTFSGNTSGSGYGGAIFNSGTLNLKNNSIFGNLVMPNQGGGIYNNIGGVLNLFNNIIANNDGGDCINLDTLSGNNNLIKSTGSNACDLTNGISGNIIGSDPNLGALAGSPAYYPLLASSLAINAGDDSICAAAPVSNTSQNGVARPQGLHCDIGSYEYIFPTERVLNGGFNKYGKGKIPTSWKAVNFSATDGKFTTTKKEGTASVKIAGTAGKTKTLTQLLTTLSGAAGDALIFSYWAKGSSIPKIGGLCQGQVLFYSGTTLKATKTVKCPTGTYNWKNVKLSFTAPVAYTKVGIKFTYSKAGGAVWFDLVSLMR